MPQTFRYSAVSVLGLVLNTIFIPTLSFMGIHYAIATLISFCTLVVIGYVLHSLWTFRSQFSVVSFVKYTSAVAINLPLTVLLLAITHDLLGIPIAIATILASAVLSVWNFVATRWAVLRQAPGS